MSISGKTWGDRMGGVKRDILELSTCLNFSVKQKVLKNYSVLILSMYVH